MLSATKSMEVPQRYQDLQLYLQVLPCQTMIDSHRALRRIEEKDMSVSQALVTPVDEVMAPIGVGPRNGFHLGPRCLSMSNDRMPKTVNGLWPPGPATPRSCAR